MPVEKQVRKIQRFGARVSEEIVDILLHVHVHDAMSVRYRWVYTLYARQVDRKKMLPALWTLQDHDEVLKRVQPVRGFGHGKKGFAR